MKRFLRTTAVAVLCATTIPNFVFAQAGTSAEEKVQQNVSGKWSGSFDYTDDDGNFKNDTAVLILKQEGTVVTGTAGPREDQQSKIEEGKANGAEIDFFVMGRTRMVFHLHLEGGHLKGEASTETEEGKKTAKLDVTRVGG